VRPYNWESVFFKQVHLADASGAVQLVSMPYFYFIQNPKWKQHTIVKFVERWLRPDTLLFMGIVWRYDFTGDVEEVRVEPQPASPYGIPIAPDSGEESDEEEQTEAVIERKEKKDTKETLKRMAEREKRNRDIMPTPGVQIEDVEETNSKVRAMLGLNCTMKELLDQNPGVEWRLAMVRTMLDRNMTLTDFKLDGLDSHPEVL
jgi:hypothetical protein